MARAMKAKWAGKLHKQHSKKWCNIPSLFFPGIAMQDFVSCMHHELYIPADLPQFYVQCLYALHEFQPSDFSEINHVRYQKI